MGIFSGQPSQPVGTEMAPTGLNIEGDQTRLKNTLGVDPEGIFTSDLSVAEYLLLQEAGFEPLGFVFGSSIYHIGLQIARFSTNQELNVLTQAMYNARELAFTRMLKEAEELHADGVAGVAVNLQTYVWGQDVLEFIATGTAIRSTHTQSVYKNKDNKPFTCNLSVQDFYRLLAVGMVPVNFVFGTCVYHIAHQGIAQSMKQSYQNQEMELFTSGIYSARELALARMQADAKRSDAKGIVGVTTAIKSHIWGEHATEFLATGTAIRKLENAQNQLLLIKPTYTLPY
jgi:uncharacterized protein YbjQ (UPF0145 family)